MSSDTFIAYVGLRFEVRADEIEGIELRSDARVAVARRLGLNYYFGNFGGLQERYLLFIGLQIGVLGIGNSKEMRFSLPNLQISFDSTAAKLKDAGFAETPELHITWQPDT